MCWVTVPLPSTGTKTSVWPPDCRTIGLAVDVTLIWQDRFIDAAKHWVGRGPGNQTPLGGSVMTLEKTAPVAILTDTGKPWPTDPPKQRGYKFLGYKLDKLGRPTFRYRGPSFTVDDKPIPVAGELVGTFKRELTVKPIEGAVATGQIYVRVAAGNVKPLGDDTFLLDDAVNIRLTSSAKPIVRQSGGKTEVLVPVDGDITVTEQITW